MTSAAFIDHGLPDLTVREFGLFQQLIYDQAGIWLAEGKRALLIARLGRRVRDLGLPNFAAYHRVVAAGDREELIRLLDLITTNETHFFREPAQFTLMAERLVREWLAQATTGRRPRRVRVWSAACSTGEEPYSIAMLLLDRLSREWTIQVEASDLSTRALARATAGIWPLEKIEPVPPAYRNRFMLRGVGPQAGRATITPAVRDVVRFQRINLVDPAWPLTGTFDAVFCRNALIYFDGESRARVIDRLVAHLAPGGYLFLGHAESLTGSTRGLRSVMPAVYQRPAAAGETAT